MIQPGTRLKVADNSGAREVACIRALGQVKPNDAQLGDIIVVAVKSAIPRATVKKKEVHKAVIVRQVKPYSRIDGTSIRFDDNAVVIINADKTPKGTRIFGPVARELRERNYTKIISLAPEVL